MEQREKSLLFSAFNSAPGMHLEKDFLSEQSFIDVKREKKEIKKKIGKLRILTQKNNSGTKNWGETKETVHLLN